MRNELLLSCLYLQAVMPQLEEVAAFDPEFRDATRDWNLSIQFAVSNGPAVTHHFREGRLESRLGRNGSGGIVVWFPSPDQVNKTFEGKNGLAIPIRGLTRLSKLLKFQKLSDKLERYLRPSEEDLKNEEIFNFHVKLMLYVALYGIKAVGENDPDMRDLAAHTANGTMELRVHGGPTAHIKLENGKFTPGKGPAKDPAVVMEIRDNRLAYDLINGRVDAMGALGACEIRMMGFLPLADNLNTIMEKVGKHLG